MELLKALSKLARSLASVWNKRGQIFQGPNLIGDSIKIHTPLFPTNNMVEISRYSDNFYCHLLNSLKLQSFENHCLTWRKRVYENIFPQWNFYREMSTVLVELKLQYLSFTNVVVICIANKTGVQGTPEAGYTRSLSSKLLIHSTPQTFLHRISLVTFCPIQLRKNVRVTDTILKRALFRVKTSAPLLLSYSCKTWIKLIMKQFCGLFKYSTYIFS